MYDKYHNWPIPEDSSYIQPNKLKETVLLDLVATKDVTERLEILDSFEAYVQRAYGQQLADSLAVGIFQFFLPYITGGIRSKLPTVSPMGRPRSVPAGEK